jgi:hypothetical protein
LLGQDERPLALLGEGILPELANTAGTHFDQLLQLHRVPTEALLKDPNRLRILKTPEDQLRFSFPLYRLGPRLEGGCDRNVGNGDQDQQSHQIVTLCSSPSPARRVCHYHSL